MYGPLACLVPRLGARKLLGGHPRLLHDTVAALSEYGLCSPAAALLLALVKQLRREVPGTGAPTPYQPEPYAHPRCKKQHHHAEHLSSGGGLSLMTGSSVLQIDPYTFRSSVPYLHEGRNEVMCRRVASAHSQALVLDLGFRV